MPDIPLYGCTPEPLMNYLKALGILRLVAEQKDKNAKGRWKDGIFWLRSELDKEGLVKFFLEEYKPTPLVAPWGARSGFFSGNSEKTARESLKKIMESDNPRFDKYNIIIEEIKKILTKHDFKEKPKDEDKEKLMYYCRAELPDDLLNWIDTTYVLTSEGKIFPPLLGTGGNEGSGSYVSGFAQQLIECIINRNFDSACEISIYGGNKDNIVSNQTPGHFSTVASSGANHGQGFDSNTRTNPWDYIFCLEGSCIWSSSYVRRGAVSQRGMASFPFTTKPTPVGHISFSQKDGKKPKGAKREIAEIWLPTWKKFTSLSEVTSLISEGRISKGTKSAEYGLDCSQAIANLGIDRGIDSFYRNTFLMRNGQSFMAIPMGLFNVRSRPDAELIREIDKWLDSFRRATSDKNAPPRFKSALRRIETAIFEYCQFGENHRFQEILCALGQAEKELALTEGKVGTAQAVSPISKLSPEWIKASNDSSVEFEIALALASIWDRERKIGPIRANMEPVTWKGHPEWKGYVSWCKKGKSVTWNNADLKDNLTAVLERRILDGNRSNCSTIPLSYFRGVSIEALSKFISGEVDDDRIAELLWGLMLIDHRKSYPEITYSRYDVLPIPRTFALLKMLYLPYDIEKNGKKFQIKTEERILPLLRSNRPGEACSIAAQRFRNSGIISMPHARNSNRDYEWAEAVNCLDSKRIAAALLIPAHHNAIDRLIKLVTRPEKVLPQGEVREIERRDQNDNRI